MGSLPTPISGKNAFIPSQRLSVDELSVKALTLILASQFGGSRSGVRPTEGVPVAGEWMGCH